MNDVTSAEAEDKLCLRPEEVDRLLQGSAWRRFVVLGDSIAEGLREPTPGYEDRSWAERLAKALRRQHPELLYRNLAKRYLRAEAVREEQLSQALALRPELAAVICGGNDLFVEEFDGDAVESELGKIVGPLREVADVVTCTLLDITQALEVPPALGSNLKNRLDELNQRIRNVAGAHEAILVDLAQEPVCADRGIYSSDYTHPSARGHAIGAALTIRALAGHLAEGRSAASASHSSRTNEGKQTAAA
jgi:lysophospholipase L1-like esterase